MTWDVGAHCVHTDTLGAELPGGQRSGPTSRWRRSWMCQSHRSWKTFPRRSRSLLPIPRLREENVEVIQRSVEGIISQEHISQRTQVVDATAPQIMEERISERMHKQVVDAPVPMTVHQPGDQACRVPTESTHRQNCRRACGDATTGPSDSDGFEDCESLDQPGDQARRVAADMLHRQGCCR